MFKKIVAYIARHIDPHLAKPLLTAQPHLVVGLSGGPDSVFLLHVLHHFRSTYGLRVTAAHLNHGWRDDADHDEQLCKTLCTSLEIPLVTRHVDDLDVSVKPNGSQEEMGRKLRRHFFEHVRKERGADYIALAHHQHDQQETFFLRLLRGCSLSGLVGMRPVHGLYVRPLLSVNKQEIKSYLHENKIEYAIDHTNTSDNYLRNRIRKYVLPALRDVDARFDKTFASSLETLHQEEAVLHGLAREAFARTFTFDGAWVGNKTLFCALEPIIQKRVIIEWLCKEQVPFTPSQAYLTEIITFLTSDRGGSHDLHATWSIVKKKVLFSIKKSAKPLE